MRRIAFVGIFLGAIGAILIGIFFGLRSNTQSSFVLPSGARIELLGTSVGRSNFTTDTAWRRMLRKNLPGSMTRWIPPAVGGGCYSSSNSVTVFIRVHDPSGMNPQPWSRYSVEDDTGFRYNAGGGLCGFGGAGPGTAVYGLIVEAFPRRQKSFLLHLVDAKGEVIGSLRVPNPVQGPFPAWQSVPMPQTQSNGPLVVTLESLRRSGSGEWRWMTPRWRVSASDAAWERASMRSVRLFDATGNEGRWLSPVEPAWKVRALAFRDRIRQFASEERLALKSLVVPRPGELVALDRTHNITGVTVRVHALAGAGQITITNNGGIGMSGTASAGHGTFSHGKVSGASWGSAEPFLLVEADGLGAEDELLFRVTDESGRELKLVDGYSGSVSGRGRFFQRKLPPGSEGKSIDVEIAVNRPLAFEFMVDPAEVR